MKTQLIDDNSTFLVDDKIQDIHFFHTPLHFGTVVQPDGSIKTDFES